jgi:predicted  nucleic acid-binding Zn-ribbon protein
MSDPDIPAFCCLEARPVTEEFDRLWALRGLDDDVVAAESALKRFPEERAAIERRVSAERQAVDQLKARVAALQLERRKLESEADALGVQEKKFQSQLPAVKKNEEYQALLHEITAAKEKRSNVETEILVRLEAEERMHAERPVLERALQADEQEMRDRLARLEAEERVEREKLAALEQQRAAELDQLTAGTRARYERIRASRDGRAVVAIIKNACGGCYRNQPPQAIQEAKRRERPIVCDGCGRLLLWPPEGAAV